MLSSSIEAAQGQVNLKAIAQPSIDPLVEGGRHLLAYVDAVLFGTNIAATRSGVVDVLGEHAAVDAAAVMGNFEMMNRIADGVGMPVGGGTRKRMHQVIVDLGLDRFPHA